jgi:HlyD family secretion protein
MKKLVVAIILALVAGTGAFIYEKYFLVPPAPQFLQAAVTDGDITEAAIATGTLSALRTVDIGTQVSGTVQKLSADFNSIVHKGQIIAQLDPAPAQQDLDSAKAAKEKAEIDLSQQQATLDVDEKNLDRAEKLHAQNLDTDQEREQAELQVKADQAVFKQDQAAIAIAQANIEQAQVNLDYCTITSPIDGVVISRNVDEGQTVASRLAAPTLYVLATDLTSLEIVADVDESDVSRIRAGQTALFTVDAYPGRQFKGSVQIVRLNATTTNNVVTYQVVADVPNPDLRLMPGMTATINIQIWQANGVMRVPATALRFRPTDDVFAALGQAIPPEAHTRLAPVPVTPQVVKTAAPAPTPVMKQAGSTIDVYFRPIQRPQSTGQVWVVRNGQLQSLQVQLGITDGTWTELVGGGLDEGEEVVNNVILPSISHKPAASTNNPLMPQGRGGPQPSRPTGR